MASRPGDWYCVRCDFRVYGWKPRCHGCGHGRLIQVMQALKKGNSAELELELGTEEGWTCFVCLNYQHGKTKCTACESEKGSWKCPDCQFVLFPSKKECRKCKTKRPNECVRRSHSNSNSKSKSEREDPGAKREGDWECLNPECKKLQFARNTFCKDCGSDREGNKPNSNSNSNSEEPESDKECIVCMVKEKNTSLLHGGESHLCVCFGCGTDLFKQGFTCPICRQPIEQVVRTFQ